MTDASDLQKRLETFISEQRGRSVAVTDLVQLPAGASRQTWSFKADGRRLVLSRDVRRDKLGFEFELLRRCEAAGVKVPKALWASDDAFGAPGFVMEHVDGETIARKILRDGEFAHARTVMAAQCGENAAAIHSVDISGLPGFEIPEGNPALLELVRYRATMDSFGGTHPPYELVIRWLEQRAPERSRVGLVHGDFRNGNFIVGPDGIRAVLDWELAHVGDPWEDLGWVCARSWRFGAPGEVGGFGAREDLYSAYEKASGILVDPAAVRWWEVYASFKWGIVTLTQSFTHLSGRVRSVELAAIGRRTAETEYDLLKLISEDV